MKAWSLNYWAARKLSLRYFFNSTSCFKSIIRLLILHFLTGDRVGILSIIQIWTSVIPFHANCWLSPLLPLKHLLLQVIKFLIKIHIIPCVVLVHLSSCPIWGEFWPDLDCASLFPSLGFPCGSADKESTCNVGDLGSIPGFDPWVGKISWRRERLLTPVFWHGEFHGLSAWGLKESDTTERLSLFLSHFPVNMPNNCILHYPKFFSVSYFSLRSESILKWFVLQ